MSMLQPPKFKLLRLSLLPRNFTIICPVTESTATLRHLYMLFQRLFCVLFNFFVLCYGSKMLNICLAHPQYARHFWVSEKQASHVTLTQPVCKSQNSHNSPPYYHLKKYFLKLVLFICLAPTGSTVYNQITHKYLAVAPAIPFSKSVCKSQNRRCVCKSQNTI